MKTVILLCLAVYCTAQTPTPCASPKQWESRILQDDPSKEYRMIGDISYDAQNQRFRIIEGDQFKGQRDFYDTLYLHNVKKEYKLNLRTRKCNVTDLFRPFRPFEIPQFAKFKFEAELGPASQPGEHMTVQMWDGEFAKGDRFGISVTMPDCVPVQDLFYSNETGLVFTEFFDTALGIADPDVFLPPRECTTP